MVFGVDVRIRVESQMPFGFRVRIFQMLWVDWTFDSRIVGFGLALLDKMVLEMVVVVIEVMMMRRMMLLYEHIMM